MNIEEIITLGRYILMVIFSIIILITIKKIKKETKTQNTKEIKITEVEPADLEFTKEMLKESFITILQGIIKTGIPAEKTYNLMLNSLKKEKKEILKEGEIANEKNSENNQN